MTITEFLTARYDERDRYWRREQREYFYAKRTEDGWDDGHPHKRDESGWCTTCMSPPGTSHSRCVTKGSP